MEAKDEKQLEAACAEDEIPEPLFPELVPVESHVDAPEQSPSSACIGGFGNEAIYDRFSRRRKRVFVAILSFCAILSPISSTGSLTAVPEIASALGSTGSVINISNGLYTAAMGISAFLWGSLSTLSGRRVVLLSSIISFFLFSLGTALSPNLAAFFVFRTLSGFGGTGLLVTGPGCIGDLYKPVSLHRYYSYKLCY
jgi:MFS family permease